MTVPPAQRLFLALWPEEAVRRRLAAVRDAVAGAARGRPVADANLHVTVVFLGAVEAAMRPAVEGAAAAAAGPAPPFELVLDRLGYWPRPRVAWLGAEEPPAPLTTLAAALRGGLAQRGIADPDPRPYRPHVTLLRNVAARPRAGPGLLDAPVCWPVSSLSLVESVTHAAGAEYRIVAAWPLGGG